MSSRTLSRDALSQLTRWTPRAKKLLNDLLNDAPSGMQKELLQRSVAAGHTPNEIHKFANRLRVLSDEEAFTACTLEIDAPREYSVTQLLQAEADPYFAFELKGSFQEVTAGKPPRSLGAATREKLAALKKGLGSLLGDASDDELTVRPSPSEVTKSASAAVPSLTLEPLLDQATQAHDLSWHEVEVDVAENMKLEAAVIAGYRALRTGLPVAMALGPEAGQTARFIVALQLNVSARSRAWQLFDPFSNELTWVNEKDLLSRKALPFSDKSLRRITRIALPTRRRTAV